MADGLTREVDRLEELWNGWEIRGAIVLSFCIQILLVITAGYRKRNQGLKLKAVSISILLWFEYMLADSVAIFGLGYLSQKQGQVSNLVILWAPFLLLHLGGQDNITALSIEDNELWKRHLLTFISQAGIAIYVFAKSGPPSSISWAGSFIFIAGIVKYVERIWALQKASMSSLRSCTIEMDKLANYAKYMETKCDDERTIVTENSEYVEGQVYKIEEDYAGVVCTAYELSPMFKPIFADLFLNYETWHRSQRYFVLLQAEKAYKVIEVELYFIYDILHTKAAVLHKWYGWLFRISTLICTITSLVIFTISNRIGYHKIEVGITYVLLAGAVVLETYAIVRMLLSLWTYAAMKKPKKCSKYKCTNWLKNKLIFLNEKLRNEEKSEWSNSLGQCSILNYNMKCKCNFIGNVMSCVGVKENWDIFWHTDYKPVEPELKKVVFSELRSKITKRNNMDIHVGFSEYREHIRSTVQQGLGNAEWQWSDVDKELDESILVWHIATDLLSHYYETEEEHITIKRAHPHVAHHNGKNVASYRHISEDISKYMLFLLIARPFMLPTGIGQIRFRDTCRHVKNILQQRVLQQRERIPQNLEEASIAIMSNERESILVARIGQAGLTKKRLDPKFGYKYIFDIGMSKLPEGVTLAKQLHRVFGREEAGRNFDRMWELISGVWVEMLCFAASKCGGYSHTKQLSMGGEFLTHVSLLMAHMGMGEEYRFGGRVKAGRH